MTAEILNEQSTSCGESPTDFFPDLETVVFYEFDSEVGPLIRCQFPPSAMLEPDVFRRVYHFLIIKRNDLCENGFSWTDDISGKAIAGYPVLIENSKYARNALIFNLCLVGNRSANVTLLLYMAEKLARLLKSAEIQQGFLSKAENRTEKLSYLIENIYSDLKSKGQTRIVLDGSFPFFIALPKMHSVKDWIKSLKMKPAQVPFFKTSGHFSDNWLITDCIGRKIIQLIDGERSLAQLSVKVPVPYTTLVAVVSQLVRLGLIGLRITVNQWDMYTVSSKLRRLLSDEKLRSECIKQATLAPTSSADATPKPAAFDNILNILSQMQHGITVGDLRFRNKAIFESININKLIIFALENKLVKRVFVSPIYTPVEQRNAVGSITCGDDSSSLLDLSGSSRDLSNAVRGAILSASSQDDSNVEYAYRLMDGNHTLEFIAARSGLDQGELLKLVRADPACQLLLR